MPEGIDPEMIRSKLQEIGNVDSIHHMRVWSLEGEQNVFTAHIKFSNISNFSQILEVKKYAKQILRRYHFSHYTLEVELDEESCDLSDEKAVDK